MSEVWVSTPAAPFPTTSETDLPLDTGIIPEDCYTCKRRLLGSVDDKKYHLSACADLHEKRAKARPETPAERLMPWAINPPTLTSAECRFCGSIIGLSRFNEHVSECKPKSPSSNLPAAVEESPLNVSPPDKKMKIDSSSEEKCHGLTDNEDSDDSDGLLTAEEAKIYNQQVWQSDGFDVDDFSHRSAIGVIIPVTLTQYMVENYVTPAATRALTEYNCLKHKDFELVEIEKMNSDGYDYFLTFKAKSGGIVETFQAKVEREIVDPGEDPYKVKLCRIKDITA